MKGKIFKAQEVDWIEAPEHFSAFSKMLVNESTGSKYFDNSNVKTKMVLQESNIENIVKPRIHSCKEGNAAYPVYVRDKHGHYGIN